MGSSGTNAYIRQVLHHAPAPPPVEARFFNASPIPIDDPLSPLPPPTTGNVSAKQPPKAFSAYDNAALDAAWNELRRKILKYNEERGEKSQSQEGSRTRRDSGSVRSKDVRRGSASNSATPRSRPTRPPASSLSQVDGPAADTEPPVDMLDGPSVGTETTGAPDTTGNPFVRAPSRKKAPTLQRDDKAGRPKIQTRDTYHWDDPSHLEDHSPAPKAGGDAKQDKIPATKVAVGVSRLHQVEMPNLEMTPIYWTPVHDTAQVIRGTWFYQDTMLPVEPPVANMLEAGYVDLQVWTETWKDELNSAIEVGAAGEMKIVHKLWPDRPTKVPDSRPSSRRGTGPRESGESLLRSATNLIVEEPETAEQARIKAVEAACDIIDISSGSDGPDNKASGTSLYGNQGTIRVYSSFGVIYANEREARLLKPSLLPSDYYGRRPLANYIRKGHKLGIAVVRGFDQTIWNKLHPPKPSPKAAQAQRGTATSASGAPPYTRRKTDPDLASAERPKVTDLIFVIHGIGQKLSQRMESFHFTHAINNFRREVSVESGNKEVKARFRKDMGGIMVLPINWRQSLSFEDDDYDGGTADNEFTLDDITPATLPSVRNIVSDVMLDIPYYMSHHQPKMIAAVIKEANHVYQLWCQNNPGFAEYGRVHIIAHSLGSVMAIDILSNQPTTVPSDLRDPTAINLEEHHLNHFLFNTSNLYLAGSPVGFFLLLKKAHLLPRIGSRAAAALNDPLANTLSVCGEQGQYGCIAVDNIYNIMNPYVRMPPSHSVHLQVPH